MHSLGKAEPAIRTILYHALNGQKYISSGVRRSRTVRIMHDSTAEGLGHETISTHAYACALLTIDGLGHATWFSTMPVSRSRTAPF